MAKPKPNKQIQTGRTLPPRFSAYTPDHEPPGKNHNRKPEIEPAVKERKLLKRSLAIFFVTVLAAFIFISVWDMRNISSASQKVFGSGSIFDLMSRQPLKGSETGRVNVLLVGYSVDDPGHPAATLTDSIILLSMSTTSKKGYMLSIPRDLYVKIPQAGYAKINEAYQDGGMPVLEQIISTNFNVPIDYYALINYASVRDTVNALGGVTVTITSPDPRGLYDPNISPHDGGPLQLSNGPQTLNGQTALNLTRARGDAYGSYGFPQADFDRTQHQRQVLTAIKDKLNWKLVLNPVKNQKILNAVADNVKTDVQATEARSLFGLFNSIPSSSLQSLSLRTLGGQNYLTSYKTPYGQSALVPSAGLSDYSQIDTELAKFNQ
jgi:polyisoprenyl-teichoic acid--peptidoglycan teichoic acid transferase